MNFILSDTVSMIFLELVPRNLTNLCENSLDFLASFSQLTGINVPDIKRLPIRSADAALALLNQSITTIPHIRTQDDTHDGHIATLSRLYTLGLRHVLLISGDTDETNPVSDVTPISLTRILKKEFNDLVIYCGIDPYRQSFKQECDYATQKLNAGADGLFSQPFFDCDLYQMYAKEFSKTQFFCGISPVTTESSFKYWQTVNHVSFTDTFNLSLDYNIKLGKDLLDCAIQNKQHAYLMPIRTPVKNYLKLIFSN